MTVTADDNAVGYGYSNVGFRSTGWIIGRIVYRRNDRAGVGYGFSTVYASVPSDPLTSGAALGDAEFGEDG